MALHIDSILHIENLPAECIEDCGKGPGAKDAAVSYWRDRLEFTVDRARAIDCLEGYGAWSREELEALDDSAIAEMILWLACGAFVEWDGTEDSACGSDIFCLE